MDLADLRVDLAEAVALGDGGNDGDGGSGGGGPPVATLSMSVDVRSQLVFQTLSP